MPHRLSPPHLPLLLALALGPSLAACTSSSGEDVSALGAESGEDAGVAFTPLTERQMLRYLQRANLGEIAAGELAQANASHQAVRDYAARMVAEHTVANQQLEALAQQLDLSFEVSVHSRVLDARLRLVDASLRRLSGERFDLAYLDSQLESHANVAFTLDALMLPEVQTEALRNELLALRPAIQQHLEDALPLQQDAQRRVQQGQTR